MNIKLLNRINDFIKKNVDENNILVYQMGKVGSTALENTITNSTHIHSLYGNEPCSAKKELGLEKNKNRVKRILFLPIKRQIIKRRKKVKIITIIRRPQERNVSMFFQDLQYWLCKYDKQNEFDTRLEGMDYIEQAYEKAFDHLYFDKWFDLEIKKLTRIDVFERCKDLKKSKLINEGRFEVLVIKYDFLNDKEVIDSIGEFVGQKIILERDNASIKKWYGEVYFENKNTLLNNKKVNSIIRSSKTYSFFYG